MSLRLVDVFVVTCWDAEVLAKTKPEAIDLAVSHLVKGHSHVPYCRTIITERTVEYIDNTAGEAPGNVLIRDVVVVADAETDS